MTNKQVNSFRFRRCLVTKGQQRPKGAAVRDLWAGEELAKARDCSARMLVPTCTQESTWGNGWGQSVVKVSRSLHGASWS